MLVEPETILAKSNHRSAPHLGGTRSTACRRLAADEQMPVRLHLVIKDLQLENFARKTRESPDSPQSSRSSNA
jgi:hypothetical protein